MGTSKRKLSSDIKKILKQKPITQLNETAPELSKKILNPNHLSSSFDTEDTINESIKIITKHFITISSNGFKGKTKKELASDSITQQEFIEMILDQIENQAYINSEILEKSLKIVMCKFLEIEEFDVYSFAHHLFYEIIYQVLLGDLNDNIKDVFEDFNYDLIKKMVKNLTDQIMNDSVYEKVNLFIDRKLYLKDVLIHISKQTSNASFGEF
ncbi:hypothetical protein [Mesobacillus zeae]|uniref:Uncharacterized protein n=1 Tax=Mesobacillus zeae TaxID=1917180 RepID=A0A398B564_9BACI|nr:hypothetical protein [Mesobacillus zeae]RID85055.1 hypothetical protein D1970_10845 [Mesobacillus zeae]